MSDSPTTQYRNRTIFHLISNYLGKFRGTKAITWNYSECGHGKGAPDGIGGYLKRTANQLVAEGTDLPTFQVLYDTLQRTCENVKLFLVNKEDIEKIDSLIEKDIPSCAGTMKIHQVVWRKQAQNLEMRRLSCFNCGTTKNCSHYGIGVFNPRPKQKEICTFNLPGISRQIKKKDRLHYEDIYNSDTSEDGAKHTVT